MADETNDQNNAVLDANHAMLAGQVEALKAIVNMLLAAHPARDAIVAAYSTYADGMIQTLKANGASEAQIKYTAMAFKHMYDTFSDGE